MDTSKESLANSHQLQSPIIVRQHTEPPRKFVVLTNQGAHIFLKQRPVDILKDILTACAGLDTDPIKTFFSTLQEDQACATALILACLESPQYEDCAEYATRAFFNFGKEPKLSTVPSAMHPLKFNQTTACK